MDIVKVTKSMHVHVLIYSLTLTVLEEVAVLIQILPDLVHEQLQVVPPHLATLRVEVKVDVLYSRKGPLAWVGNVSIYKHVIYSTGPSSDTGIIFRRLTYYFIGLITGCFF